MNKRTQVEHTMSISEVQDKITRLPEQFQEDPEAVTVTRHGKPVMTILPFNEYQSLLETVESLMETMEILQDKELMAAFRQGVQEFAEGKGRPLDEVLKELGWE
jgi:prevent-host-death family protein